MTIQAAQDLKSGNARGPIVSGLAQPGPSSASRDRLEEATLRIQELINRFEPIRALRAEFHTLYINRLNAGRSVSTADAKAKPDAALEHMRMSNVSFLEKQDRGMRKSLKVGWAYFMIFWAFLYLQRLEHKLFHC